MAKGAIYGIKACDKIFLMNLVYKIHGNLNGKMKIIKKTRNMVCIKDINAKYNGKMI